MAEKKIYIIESDSEADTCRKEVLPQLYSSQWNDEQILEQRTFTDGKIIVIGRKAKRKKAKKFDYLLRYSQSFPIAIVEAKVRYKKAGDGMQQAKDYAEILGLKFAYSTNGTEILEYDFTTGVERKVSKYPAPEELWNRLNELEPVKPAIQETLLKPMAAVPGKELRYYQINAINAATKAILEGRKKALLTLATGTGKTTVAFQIIHKLWQNRWNAKGEHRRPKVLFIADRSVLVSDPHSKDFASFGDARCLVPEEGLPSSREVYFSTYQSLAEDSSRPGAFRKLPRDFFDLVVIDECHRGSASEESNWRLILDYFSYAVHLGLTATPLRDDNKDTYLYFGNPLYTYSLRQGIEDGFLAPYLVHRIIPEVDATGFRPTLGQRDANGQLIPDGLYTTPDFENTVSILPRTKAVAKHLYNFMQKHGAFDKTIVFCNDEPHADDFRREFSNLSRSLMQQYPNYCVRITTSEGEIGKGFLSKFMDIEQPLPVVVTTSKLLSTGIDAQTCKNIVIFRMVGSMTEFKQIIGRGTRVREDKNKLFFTILDYTGSASRNFADPDFDGEPPLISEELIDVNGEPIPDSEVEYHAPQNIDEDEDDGDDFTGTTGVGEPRRKYRVEEGEMGIAYETVQVLDANGRLRVVSLTNYTQEQVTTLFSSAAEFKQHWMNPQEREEIIEKLAENGISIEHLQETVDLKEADIFDVLCFVAFNLKPLTRKQRAEYIEQNKKDFFAVYSDKAKEILHIILNKYVEFGNNQLQPNIIAVDTFSTFGNPLEIVNEFGGLDGFKNAMNQLQKLLYAA